MQERWHGFDGDVVPPLEADVSEAGDETYLPGGSKEGSYRINYRY